MPRTVLSIWPQARAGWSSIIASQVRGSQFVYFSPNSHSNRKWSRGCGDSKQTFHPPVRKIKSCKVKSTAKRHRVIWSYAPWLHDMLAQRDKQAVKKRAALFHGMLCSSAFSCAYSCNGSVTHMSQIPRNIYVSIFTSQHSSILRTRFQFSRRPSGKI